MLVPRDAWEQLVSGTVSIPELPPADGLGNRDAIAFARVSIARHIIRDRIAAGLSQARLAKLAGMDPATLNRIEKAKVTPDEATVAKLEKAIRGAASKAPNRNAGSTKVRIVGTNVRTRSGRFRFGDPGRAGRVGPAKQAKKKSIG
jgi:DNA-binding XRE family transcriptional regulator